MRTKLHYWFAVRVSVLTGLHMYDENGRLLPQSVAAALLSLSIILISLSHQLTSQTFVFFNAITTGALVIQVCSVTLFYLMDVLFSSRIRRLLTDLLELEECLVNRGFHERERVLNEVGRFSRDMVFFGGILVSELVLFKGKNNFYVSIIYSLSTFLRVVYRMFITHILRTITSHLESARRSLSYCTSLQMAKTNCSIFAAHQRLCPVLNRLYGLQTLGFLINLFTATLVCILVPIQILANPVSVDVFDVTDKHIYLFIWAGTGTYEIVSFVNGFIKLEEKAHEFSMELYDKALEDETSLISCDKNVMTHILSNRDFSFAPLGLFKINYNLITDMVLAISTYIIILVQLMNTSCRTCPETTT